MIQNQHLDEDQQSVCLEQVIWYNMHWESKKKHRRKRTNIYRAKREEEDLKMFRQLGLINEA